MIYNFNNCFILDFININIYIKYYNLIYVTCYYGNIGI